MGKSVVAFQNQTHIRVFWFRHVRVDQREGEGEGFINANESLALKSLFRPHDLSLHVYIDGEFLGGELVHVFEEGPRTCSTYALDSGGLKKSRPHHEKTSCFVKVCVCVWYDKARPLLQCGARIPRIFPPLFGWFRQWMDNLKEAKERKESHAHPGCGGSNSWPSQTTMEF